MSRAGRTKLLGHVTNSQLTRIVLQLLRNKLSTTRMVLRLLRNKLSTDNYGSTASAHEMGFDALYSTAFLPGNRAIKNAVTLIHILLRFVIDYWVVKKSIDEH